MTCRIMIVDQNNNAPFVTINDTEVCGFLEPGKSIIPITIDDRIGDFFTLKKNKTTK